MAWTKVAVVLPTFNEVAAIEDIIRRVRETGQQAGQDYEIHVVDSGSTDGTVEAAHHSGVNLILLEKRGKGIAIRKAFQEIEADALVLLDSDLSYLPEEIPKLLAALEGYDVVVGSRFRGAIEKGAMKGTNRIGNLALTTLAKTLYGAQISDVCSGFWAFRKEAYKSMDINARHFELEANFYVECARKRLKLGEVPIDYKLRRGETKLAIVHGFGIGGYLVSKRI